MDLFIQARYVFKNIYRYWLLLGLINSLITYSGISASMDLGAFIREMELIAPPDLAEPWDRNRIGLIIEGGEDIGRVCSALDATPAVVAGAIEHDADMIVVHHTPLWDPVTRLSGSLMPILRSILAADIGLYVMHTNFDRAPGGVNDTLASLLSVTGMEPMTTGLIGTCNLSPAEIRDRLRSPLRVWGRIDRIRRIGLVAGSGFDPHLIREAAKLGADAFLSAELKHAVFRDSPLPCIEATHYALEAPGMKALAARMGWTFIDDPPLVTCYG
jgi:dinuclear metal center YbgI/SA1388 family protein